MPSPVPPTWPGLDPDDDRETTGPFPKETVLQSAAPQLEHRVAPKRGVPWFTLTMLGLIVGSVTWLAFQGPQPLTVPQLDPPVPPAAPPETTGTASAVAVLTPPTPPLDLKIPPPAAIPPPPSMNPKGSASAAKAAPAPVAAHKGRDLVTQTKPPQPPAVPANPKSPAPVAQAKSPPLEPAPEIKPAIPNATPDEIAALRVRAAEEHLAAITEVMVKGLEKAVTDSDRLQWVDATETQQAEMKKFFEAHHGKLESVKLEPSAGKVTLLPSGEEMRLFRLTTKSCRDGAILQIREDGGRAKLRWGLFEQSHEKTYDRFLTAVNESGSPRWFTLLCQRAHSFELKGPTKDRWICLDAQGSLTSAGTGQIYANKDSPVGRFLEPKAEWGRLYLIELLVGKMDVDGRRLNVVLDCAGLRGDTRRR